MFWLVTTIIAFIYAWIIVLDVDEVLPEWTRGLALVAAYYAATVVLLTGFWLAWKAAS